MELPVIIPLVLLGFSIGLYLGLKREGKDLDRRLRESEKLKPGE